MNSEGRHAANPARSSRPGRLPRDFLVGLGMLAFCAVVYWLSLDIKLAPKALAQTIQPSVFPRMVLAVIALLAGLMMVRSFRIDSSPARPVRPMVLFTAAMMLGFVVVFQVLGIVAAMVLFCAAMPVAWGARRWAAVIGFAVLFPAAVYAVFAIGLSVHFEPGILAWF